MNKKPNIFEFIDYKKYLTIWRLFEKDRNIGLTHEYLCNKLGQKNRSFYSDLEKGRKIIGAEVFDRLVKLFDLNSTEAKYFRALVGYGQPSTYAEKEFWFEQIVELNNTPKKIIDKKTLRYFNEWHHASIRAVLDTTDIRDDYRKLSLLLYSRITPDEAKESLDILNHLCLIEQNKEGYWKPTDKVISSGDNVKDECLRRYQLAHHNLLTKILEDDHPGTHDSTQMTVSVSKKGIERIVKRLKQVRSEIMSISHKDEDKADRVYQITIHAYPISRKS